MNHPQDPSDFANLVQRYFCSYLIKQRRLSFHTLSAYRDTFRIFLPFLAQTLNKTIDSLSLSEVSATHIILFLNHLEENRGNSVSTRNARLAAIRAFLNYATIEVPDVLADLRKALSVPQKRRDRPLIGCLDKAEMQAILAAPDAATWSGRRDRVLLLTMYNTGARVSEIVGIRRQDLDLKQHHTVHLHGKGRKERVIPLWSETVVALRTWLNNDPQLTSNIVFPNRFGQALTRSGVRQRLMCAYRSASKTCGSLKSHNVTPHVVRHTTALHLLQSGVDLLSLYG